MKMKVVVGLLLVAGIAQAGIMEGMQFGGVDRDKNWKDSLTWASTTDADLVFTIDVSVTGTNAVPADNTLFADGTSLGVYSAVGDQKRLGLGETVTVSLSYVDPNSSLMSLELLNISALWNSNTGETTDFIDQLGNRITRFETDDEVAYNTTGLEALTKDNAMTGWTLTAEGMTASTASGFGALDLQYEVVPEPATLGLVAMVGGALIFIRRRMI